MISCQRAATLHLENKSLKALTICTSEASGSQTVSVQGRGCFWLGSSDGWTVGRGYCGVMIFFVNWNAHAFHEVDEMMAV